MKVRLCAISIFLNFPRDARLLIVMIHISGMTKIKINKDESSVEFIEKRRAALERYLYSRNIPLDRALY